MTDKNNTHDTRPGEPKTQTNPEMPITKDKREHQASASHNSNTSKVEEENEDEVRSDSKASSRHSSN